MKKVITFIVILILMSSLYASILIPNTYMEDGVVIEYNSFENYFTIRTNITT